MRTALQPPKQGLYGSDGMTGFSIFGFGLFLICKIRFSMMLLRWTFLFFLHHDQKSVRNKSAFPEHGGIFITGSAGKKSASLWL